jgi:two-component system nitrate/nitrite response regulator NarL
MNERPIRLLLIDGHRSFRASIAFMLEHEPGLDVVAQAGSMADVRQLLAGPPVEIDLALLDLNLADGNGLDLIADLRARHPHLIVLVLTGSSSSNDRAYAVEAGAAAVLHKSVEIKEITDGIRRLWQGESLMSTHEMVELLRAAGRLRTRQLAARATLERLTDREREVLQALADGLSDKAIARRLGVSDKTARGHVMNLLGKLGAESRLQAVVLAARAGAISFTE